MRSYLTSNLNVDIEPGKFFCETQP